MLDDRTELMLKVASTLTAEDLDTLRATPVDAGPAVDFTEPTGHDEPTSVNEEPVKSVLKRLPGIRGTGLTPLGEAMQVGASRLLPRPESRKIMLVLTDGRAGCECGDGSSQLHAQHIALLCRKAGIELIGVGIQDESLRQIVADAIVIHELVRPVCSKPGQNPF